VKGTAKGKNKAQKRRRVSGFLSLEPLFNFQAISKHFIQKNCGKLFLTIFSKSKFEAIITAVQIGFQTI
jgi:hypothetical protein